VWLVPLDGIGVPKDLSGGRSLAVGYDVAIYGRGRGLGGGLVGGVGVEAVVEQALDPVPGLGELLADPVPGRQHAVNEARPRVGQEGGRLDPGDFQAVRDPREDRPYEDTNDAERLAVDPAMRHVVGGRAIDKQAASTSQMWRFETEVLTQPKNLAALTDLSGRWIDVVHQHKPIREIVLELDSSVSETSSG